MEVLKVVKKAMNVLPHLVHGCNTEARSGFDYFTLQRMEKDVSNTHDIVHLSSEITT